MTRQHEEPRYDAPQWDVLLPRLTDAGRDPVAEVPTTYYGRPMVKRPTWKWYIPTYFWLGGIAGGAALVGAAADLIGGERHRPTVRHARWLTLALAAVCPIPLIIDLGRPERFYRMLRIFKVTSPLNLGTWILSAFGAVSALAVAHQAATDGLVIARDGALGRLLRALPSGPISALHGMLGIALGGYTGTLLAVTAVPLWAAGGVLLGPLFLSTAVASGAAALALIALLRGETLGAHEQIEQIEQIESLSAALQLGLVLAREAVVSPAINGPLRRGLWGRLYQFGAVGGGMIAPTGLRLLTRLGGERVAGLRRGVSLASATLTLIGALIERFAITEAGKLSADDPLAYQALSAARPGEARPTPAEQRGRAPAALPFTPGVSVSDYIG